MIWKTEHLDYFARDCFNGMCASRPDIWQVGYTQKNAAVLLKAKPTFDQFAVIVSGGAGNGPLFPGYVGEGLADAAAVGGPYSAPNAYAILEAGRMLGRKKGVLLLYNNFAGDYLNNDMAQEMLETEGIAVESVIVSDDVATALGEPKENRSGRCGIALLIKLAGAYAAAGMPLKEAAQKLRHAATRLGTLSLHLDEAQSMVYYGGGISGEPPIRTETHMDVHKAAAEVCRMLLADLQPTADEKLFLMINRLRMTSYADGYVMADAISRELPLHHDVAEVRCGVYSNVRDCYGYDFSILCMDEETCSYMSSRIQTDSFVI